MDADLPGIVIGEHPMVYLLLFLAGHPIVIGQKLKNPGRGNSRPGQIVHNQYFMPPLSGSA
jgi:hypothetical protein